MVMCEPANTPRTARELALKLVPLLEKLANLRYLIENDVDVQDFREAEKQTLNELAQTVLDSLHN